MTQDEAEQELGKAIGIPLCDLVNVRCDNGTYYYKTQAEAESDHDGAYAWSITRDPFDE